MSGAVSVESFADRRLGDDLLWRDVRVQPFRRPTPALFLDRDGVIVEEKLYLSSPSQVELLPGIIEVIRAARTQGMAVVEITNQAGIAHGYFGWSEFVQVENRIAEIMADQGVRLDAVLACPFHPNGVDPYRAQDHPWRKPNPGMLLEAARLLNLSLEQSLLMGDKALDIQAAQAGNLACGIHVLTGHGRANQLTSSALATPNFPVYVVESAYQVLPLLTKRPARPRVVI